MSTLDSWPKDKLTSWTALARHTLSLGACTCGCLLLVDGGRLDACAELSLLAFGQAANGRDAACTLSHTQRAEQRADWGLLEGRSPNIAGGAMAGASFPLACHRGHREHGTAELMAPHQQVMKQLPKGKPRLALKTGKSTQRRTKVRFQRLTLARPRGHTRSPAGRPQTWRRRGSPWPWQVDRANQQCVSVNRVRCADSDSFVEQKIQSDIFRSEFLWYPKSSRASQFRAVSNYNGHDFAAGLVFTWGCFS